MQEQPTSPLQSSRSRAIFRSDRRWVTTPSFPWRVSFTPKRLRINTSPPEKDLRSLHESARITRSCGNDDGVPSVLRSHRSMHYHFLHGAGWLAHANHKHLEKWQRESVRVIAMRPTVSAHKVRRQRHGHLLRCDLWHVHREASRPRSFSEVEIWGTKWRIM